MKVLFVSDPLYVESEIYNCEAYANLPMLKVMSCELQVATTLQQARDMIPGVDVVLLEGLRAVHFRDELSFINDYDVLVGAFYCDVWRGPFWYQTLIHIDLNISVYKAVALKAHSTWEEGKNFFWLPPRIDAVPYKSDRDVEIVTWGASGREYPYRNYVQHALLGAMVGGARRNATPTKVEPGLTANRVKICNEEYTWHSIGGKRMQGPFYGQKLFDALSRCCICPTGPVVQHRVGSVVARYFENAAAGLVTLTPFVEDAEALGFKHNETIWVGNSESFYSDICTLVQEVGLRQRISREAVQLIASRHSVAVRAGELYKRLKELC